LQVFLAGCGHDRSCDSSDHRSDGRAATPVGDTADDGPQTGAAADLLCCALALTLALCDGVICNDLVREVTERDRVQLQADLVAALQGPGLLDAGDLDHDRCSAGDHHATVDHDR